MLISWSQIHGTASFEIFDKASTSRLCGLPLSACVLCVRGLGELSSSGAGVGEPSIQTCRMKAVSFFCLDRELWEQFERLHLKTDIWQV